MGRKILLVTTDQQRFDTLGCNGGALSRTPVVDAPGRRGRPLRPGPPPVGGVHAVPLHHPDGPAPEHPRGVHERRAAPAGRALGGRGRCGPRATAPRWSARPTSSPYFDPFLRFEENLLSTTGTTPHGGSRRGFEHLETASPRRHGPAPLRPVADAAPPRGPRHVLPRPSTTQLQVSAEAGGDTGAPQVKVNPIERGIYHTDWVADRTIDWLDSLGRRRGLVLLDELPRPPPPVGPAGVRGGPGRLARGAPPGRLSRGPGRPGRRSSTASRATGGPGTTARWCPTTRPRPTGCRPP